MKKNNEEAHIMANTEKRTEVRGGVHLLNRYGKSGGFGLL